MTDTLGRPDTGPQVINKTGSDQFHGLQMVILLIMGAMDYLKLKKKLNQKYVLYPYFGLYMLMEKMHFLFVGDIKPGLRDRLPQTKNWCKKICLF